MGWYEFVAPDDDLAAELRAARRSERSRELWADPVYRANHSAKRGELWWRSIALVAPTLTKDEHALLVTRVVGPGTCERCGGIVLTPAGTRHTWNCRQYRR